jgi:hypothetical protein
MIQSLFGGHLRRTVTNTVGRKTLCEEEKKLYKIIRINYIRNAVFPPTAFRKNR